jgi:allantoin racemase
MRILLINGNTTAAVTARCAASARRAAADGTEIIAATAATGPRIINTRTENALAVAEIIRIYAEHAETVDAVVIAVSFDTALDALKEAAHCPVVGMTEAALLVASALGSRIGFAAPGARSLNVYRSVVERTGLLARTDFAVVDMTPSDYDDPSRTLAAIERICEGLVATGAESIVLAGAVFAGFAPRLAETVRVPVIDGAAAATVLAEGLVRLRFPKARAGSYAALPARELTGIDAAIAGLFGREV